MALITPEYLQTKSYAANKDRRVSQALVMQEGILDLGHYKPTQRGAGANMSVDIASGEAWVDGDSAADQGFYHVVNDATVNVAIANNSSGNPRIDQIVLKVNDSADAGSGTDIPALEVVQGTPTGAATLANRSGAAALPNTALKLADVLVANGAVKIENASIGNLRDHKAGLTGYPPVTAVLSIAGAQPQYAMGRPVSYVPSVYAQRAANQEVANGGNVAINLNTADGWDTDEMHDTVTNNTRLTVRTPGFYVFTGRTSFDASAGTYGSIEIKINGSVQLSGQVITGGYWVMATTAQYRLGYGDYAELNIGNSSGAARQASGTQFSATWLGP